MPLRVLGLKIPVTFSPPLCCLLCLLLRSAFNFHCRFMGIRKRYEGHGLTFVYLKRYGLPKCCCFVPCRPREKDRDVWPDFSPSTNTLWKPSLDRHGNAFRRTYFSDIAAPCLLPPSLQSTYPAWQHSFCLLRLAKHLLPNSQEYVYNKPSGCDWAAVLKKLI